MKKQVLVDGVAYDAKALELFADIADAYATFANLVAQAQFLNGIYLDRTDMAIYSVCDNCYLALDFISGDTNPLQAVDQAQRIVKIIDAAFKESNV